MRYPDSRLLIFSKAPEPGQVKTRLIPLLGAVKAAELYAGLLHEAINKAVSAALCPVDIWCSPSTVHPFFRNCREQYGVGLQTQRQGDLGQRMSHALQASLLQSRYAILLGADVPALTAGDIENAFHAFSRGADVVLGPAEDGGYYLIGMHKLHAFLFDDIPWSTPDVLDITEARIRERGLDCHRLPVYSDLDTPDDYRTYTGLN